MYLLRERVLRRAVGGLEHEVAERRLSEARCLRDNVLLLRAQPQLHPGLPPGLFLAAVMVSAWHGGMRPAVLATALSVPLLAVIARYQAPGPEEDVVLRLGLFVLVGLIAGYLSQQCRQAIRAVEQVHD